MAAFGFGPPSYFNAIADVSDPSANALLQYIVKKQRGDEIAGGKLGGVVRDPSLNPLWNKPASLGVDWNRLQLKGRPDPYAHPGPEPNRLLELLGNAYQPSTGIAGGLGFLLMNALNPIGRKKDQPSSIDYIGSY